MKRRRTLTVAGLGGAVIVVAGLAVGGGSGGGGDDDGRSAPASRSTAEATRRDLTDRTELDGVLGYGDSRELTVGAGGTITDLAPEGTVVGHGGVLARIDDEPVVLLPGRLPAWRTLDSSTDGDDVRQLEQALVDLGQATADELTVDGEWTSATTEAVEDLQASVGAEEDGTLELGSVTFSPLALRIANHLADIGSSAGGPALEVTGFGQVVTVDLAAEDQGLVEVGQDVEVDLPDGTTASGVVSAVADVVDPPAAEGEGSTIEVTISLDDPAAAAGLDQAPVDVAVITVAVEDALTVPVEALLALAEGGYAVERPDGTLVGVTLGAFADGFVEVTPTTGTLEAGDRVVVPA